jgi:hypothetical protein
MGVGRFLVESGLPLAGGIVGAGGELDWPNPTRSVLAPSVNAVTTCFRQLSGGIPEIICSSRARLILTPATKHLKEAIDHGKQGHADVARPASSGCKTPRSNSRDAPRF